MCVRNHAVGLLALQKARLIEWRLLVVRVEAVYLDFWRRAGPFLRLNHMNRGYLFVYLFCCACL